MDNLEKYRQDAREHAQHELHELNVILDRNGVSGTTQYKVVSAPW